MSKRFLRFIAIAGLCVGLQAVHTGGAYAKDVPAPLLGCNEDAQLSCPQACAPFNWNTNWSCQGIWDKQGVKDYSCVCGCTTDYNAPLVTSQCEADEQCPKICAAHGGWEGNWDQGVCQCNSFVRQRPPQTSIKKQKVPPLTSKTPIKAELNETYCSH